MTMPDDTTITNYAEDDKDELLLLTGLERLEYFSAKPQLKKMNLKQQFVQFFKKITL